ncbi:MAG: hypothetical protein ACK559_24740 [bacterium]
MGPRLAAQGGRLSPVASPRSLMSSLGSSAFTSRLTDPSAPVPVSRMRPDASRLAPPTAPMRKARRSSPLAPDCRSTATSRAVTAFSSTSPAFSLRRRSGASACGNINARSAPTPSRAAAEKAGTPCGA